MSPNLAPSLTFLRQLLRLRLAEHLGHGGVAVPPVPVLQDDDTPCHPLHTAQAAHGGRVCGNIINY